MVNSIAKELQMTQTMRKNVTPQRRNAAKL